MFFQISKNTEKLYPLTLPTVPPPPPFFPVALMLLQPLDCRVKQPMFPKLRSCCTAWPFWEELWSLGELFVSFLLHTGPLGDEYDGSCWFFHVFSAFSKKKMNHGSLEDLLFQRPRFPSLTPSHRRPSDILRYQASIDRCFQWVKSQSPCLIHIVLAAFCSAFEGLFLLLVGNIFPLILHGFAGKCKEKQGAF